MSADLIARLESATEGSRELDAQIECSVRGWQLLEISSTGAYSFRHKEKDFNYPSGAPCYTESLDAALTLVPAIWRVYNIKEAYIYPPNKWFACLERRREHRESMIGKAPTPALALCIAALKARNIT